MMLFQAPLEKRLIWLMPIIAVCVLLAGCIADPVQPFQVRPETVVAPQNPFFQAINYQQYSSPPSGQMLVRWNRSAADTQLNFKGYFVELWKSDTSNYVFNGLTLDTLLDSAQILPPPHPSNVSPKLTDTFYTFTNRPGYPAIPTGQYAVRVFSMKTSASDTTIYSVDSSIYWSLYDPLPMQNPYNLRATSTGPTNVELHWTLPVTDKDIGFYQYVVYYRDTLPQAHDTGHIAAIVPKGLGDSSTFVTIPAATGTGVVATEYPYEFWVKSERNDSTFFYGPDMYGPDTNHIVWAGAEECPKSYPGVDSGGWGGFHKSLFFGSQNGQWDMVDDSNRSDAQVVFSIDSATQFISLTGMNGTMFLVQNGTVRIDTTPSLDSLYYSAPLSDPALFTKSFVQLPTPNSTGIVMYLRMIDQTYLKNQPEYARLFIQRQANGTFLNTSNGLHCQSSFQPGTDKSGTVHLPFY